MEMENRMKRWEFLVIVGVVLGAGCQKTETSTMDCAAWYASLDATQDLGPEVAAEIASEVATDAAVPDVEADLVVSKLPAGAACVENSQCATTQCFCGEEITDKCFDLKGTAQGMGANFDYVLTGGMCSKLFCDPKKADACGAGGFCFDVGPLFQSSMTIGLCLAYCDEYDDCRFEEGYVCYFTGVEGQRACLPYDLVKDIPCGDGTCAVGETLSVCPRDCFCGNGTCDSGEDNATCGEDCP